ncbi:uncharacterized protein LOC135846471 [Planococcus citri]|uniref:uncharacterized protein LOC135846471 n=1 Tax=Planococcus citri TaxID=170843 RepID=UPI0031FA06C0
MLIKFGLMICTVFTLIRNGDSEMDKFGSFWGSCPEQPINSSLSSTPWDIQGRWYTHWILGQYSPWKYTECQSNEIHGGGSQKTTVVTRFKDHFTQMFVEWNGDVHILDSDIGKYVFDYNMYDWFLSQNTVFLQIYPQGAALVWTCMEFDTFHFESVAVMTRYQDPHDHRVYHRIFENMNDILRNYGISPTWLEQINQSSCEQIDSSIAHQSFL